MIPVAKVRKPRGFDAKVKTPGDAWLAANPQAKRPKALWAPYTAELSDGFGGLCGYAAMLDPYQVGDHDQGQIAIKLMGFSKGVTVQGGLPIPITTPAHGTAFDIAGQGIADANAMRNAFDIAARMGAAIL